MEEKQIIFKSYNNLHNINAVIFSDKLKVPKGVIQIVHGMNEHVEKYRHVAEFFTSKGYIVAVSDAPGHGHSVIDKNSFGYFGNNGDDVLVEDIYTFYKILKEKYNGLPFFMMGHSMGSFIVRKFMYKYKYNDITSFLILGTSYKRYECIVGYKILKFLNDLGFSKVKGKRIIKMSFKRYNKKLRSKNGNWLSRDSEYVKKVRNDELSNFIFTLNGFMYLFALLNFVNSKKWYNNINKKSNIFILSGDRDVIGHNSKGVIKVYQHLKHANVDNTKLKLYRNFRHEIVNEIGKERVFDDILKHLNSLENNIVN